MSTKNPNNPNQEQKEPIAKTVIETEEESVVRVTWEDGDGNVLVTGEKKVRGGPSEAAKVADKFAGDLKKNFAKRFPAPIVPPGLMEDEEGGEE